MRILNSEMLLCKYTETVEYVKKQATFLKKNANFTVKEYYL